MPHDASSDVPTRQGSTASPAVAAVVASSAYLVPLALSASSRPSPEHPTVLAWYRSLRKPAFKPPDWVIPLAWIGIESALGGAAYRLLRAAPSRPQRRALSLLAWNVFAIGGWSRLFFRQRRLGGSTLAAATMIVSGAEFVRQAKSVDRTASRAGIPFVAWVSFATALTATIWAMNRDE